MPASVVPEDGGVSRNSLPLDLTGPVGDLLRNLAAASNSDPRADAELSRSRFFIKQCSSFAVAFCLLLTTALYFVGQVDGLKLLLVALLNQTASEPPSQCPESR
jgi:hypothetical protein